MKTLLIIDAGLGQARAYMAKTLLSAAAQKAAITKKYAPIPGLSSLPSFRFTAKRPPSGGNQPH